MSVCRFKCVSKAWHDLIVDPDNRNKLCQGMKGLFFMTTSDKGHFNFGFMALTAGSSSTVDIDPGFSFLTERPAGNHSLVLLDSCNGLLLFGHEREPPYYDDPLGYIVCNTTTKQWEAVQTCASPRGGNCSYLGTYLAFDPAVSYHFHLVRFQKTVGIGLVFMSMHAYSSETRTWSHHNQTVEENVQGQSVGLWNLLYLSMGFGCVFVNGLLHLIVGDSEKLKIVVVDVQGRARRMIKLPNENAANRGICRCIYFGQSQGYLHCVTKEPFHFLEKGYYRLSIWVLREYDVEEWVLKDVVSSLELFGEKPQRNVMFDCEVADMHLDCNVVFFFSPCQHKFIAYDMDRKKLCVLDATSKCTSRLRVGRYVPHF